MTTRLSLVMCLVCATALLTLSREALAQSIPCRYEVAAVIQGPPCGILATITTAPAINNIGTVVGHYRCQAGNPRPFKWTQAGGLELIPLPSWLLEASPAGEVGTATTLEKSGEVGTATTLGKSGEVGTATTLEKSGQPLLWESRGQPELGYRSVSAGGDWERRQALARAACAQLSPGRA